MVVGRGWQHGRRKGEMMGKWEKEKERKGKERNGKWVAALGFGLGHKNGGGKWAMMGWNWSWAKRNGLG